MKFSIAPGNRRVQIPLESRPDIAAIVGLIIGQFAITERYIPGLLSTVTALAEQDAEGVLSVFRAFSNKIDLLESVATRRTAGGWEKTIISYYKGLLNEANSIRNKYSHAAYAAGDGKDLTLFPFASDRNRAPKAFPLTLNSAQADLAKIVRINGELDELLHLARVPKGLHAQLPPQAQG